MMIGNRLCTLDGLATSGAGAAHLASVKAKGIEEDTIPRFERSLTVAEPMPEESPFMPASAPTEEFVQALELDGHEFPNWKSSEPAAPTRPIAFYSSGRAEKAFKVMDGTPSKAVNVYSSGRAEKSFKVVDGTPSKAVNVYSSGRAERAFKVMDGTPSKAVNVYSSGRAERAFKVMDGTPSKAVSVYSSGRAERAFKVMDGTPSKAVSVYSSGRAERNFEVMDGTPSKAVSVYSSGRAEKACEFMSEFDLEQFDLFAEVTKPLNMIFPEEEEFVSKPPVPVPQMKVLARPAVFSSRRAEFGCNLPRTEPLVPTNIYSSARAEMACMPPTFVEDQPEKRVYTQHVYSSGRAERSFNVMTDTPSKAVNVYSSGRAEKAFKVMTDTPSKAVNVYSSGRAEKAFKVMDGTPSKPVSVFNSRRAEGSTLPPFVEDQSDEVATKATEECEGFSEAWAWLADAGKPDAPFDSGKDVKGTLLDSPQRAMSVVEPCPELSPSRRRLVG